MEADACAPVLSLGCLRLLAMCMEVKTNAHPGTARHNIPKKCDTATKSKRECSLDSVYSASPTPQRRFVPRSCTGKQTNSLRNMCKPPKVAVFIRAPQPPDSPPREG
ncbi:hypothetical protein TcCL_NonESM12771 [Trypanosoma cruzi]|nr:hypothetical protein TcCL_NonESM12771 [Trypanosoma cruzi]